MNHATWPLRIVAAAADMKPRALRQYFDTHVLNFRGDDNRSTGTGVPVGLSKHRAYEATIVQHLTRLGFSPSRAAAAAYEFTITGNSGRAAGELFEHGKSLLVIGTTGISVQNAFFDTTLADVSKRGICTICIDLNRVVEQVDTVLNNIS